MIKDIISIYFTLIKEKSKNSKPLFILKYNFSNTNSKQTKKYSQPFSELPNFVKKTIVEKLSENVKEYFTINDQLYLNTSINKIVLKKISDIAFNSYNIPEDSFKLKENSTDSGKEQILYFNKSLKLNSLIDIIKMIKYRGFFVNINNFNPLFDKNLEILENILISIPNSKDIEFLLTNENDYLEILIEDLAGFDTNFVESILELIYGINILNILIKDFSNTSIKCLYEIKKLFTNQNNIELYDVLNTLNYNFEYKI